MSELRPCQPDKLEAELVDLGPRHDRFLPEHYDPQHLEVKARLKQLLLGRHGLEGGVTVPLAGMVSRLAPQKGIELMFGALPKILSARPLNFIALGSGEPQYERFFSQLARTVDGGTSWALINAPVGFRAGGTSGFRE